MSVQTAITICCSAPASTAEVACAAIALPAWAANERGLSVLAQIAREKPDMRVGSAMGFRIQEYCGKPAMELRRILREQEEVASAEAQRRYVAGDDWNESSRALDALFVSEQPDALISRILRDPIAEASFAGLRL